MSVPPEIKERMSKAAYEQIMRYNLDFQADLIELALQRSKEENSTQIQRKHVKTAYDQLRDCSKSRLRRASRELFIFLGGIFITPLIQAIIEILSAPPQQSPTIPLAQVILALFGGILFLASSFLD